MLFHLPFLFPLGTSILYFNEAQLSSFLKKFFSLLGECKKPTCSWNYAAAFCPMKQDFTMQRPLRVLSIYGKLLHGRKVSYMVSFSLWALCLAQKKGGDRNDGL